MMLASEDDVQKEGRMGNKIKELSYYLFFGIMVFAKGIGLDSGDRLYYWLGAAACLCVACKLVLTKYSRKQVAVMGLLCLLALAAWRNSGRMGIVLSVLAIIGMKDMDLKKLFRLGAVIYGVSFAFTVLAAGFGMISNPLAVHEKGGIEVIRWGMGYSTGNVFHASYFILAVFLCYTWGKDYGVKKLVGLLAGNLLVFLFSLSYTGVAVTAFYLLLNLYAVRRRRLSGAERLLCQLPLPLCLLFSFGTPFLLGHPAVQRLDELLQARLTFSAYYLQNQPITLLGTRMKDIPNFWIIMDNGYVYCLMTFGVVTALLLFTGYGVLIGRYSGLAFRPGGTYGPGEGDGERLQELAIIFSCLLYGIMEQFITNAFMNLSLLFLAELLFGSCRGACGGEAGRPEKVRVFSERGEPRSRGWPACILTGLAIFVLYMQRAERPECILIPIDSLNYVDGVSVRLQVENPGNTKEYLKEAMKECQTILEAPELLHGALQAAGAVELLTEEELKAALEYSLPVSVHRDGRYDTFRVRLLKLYCDVSPKQYDQLMEYMVAAVGGRYTSPEGIYEERIGKSFGEDRIEHMSAEKEFLAEKEGPMVEVEAVRKGVFYGTAGMGVICAVFTGRRKIRGMKLSK